MTVISQLIDGMGQIGTRVYADFASLPSPRLGAFAIVDGGTGGVLYVGLHDIGGTLSWIEWSALYNAILKNPPSGWNVITNSFDAYGLAIDSAGRGLGVQTTLANFTANQTGTPTEAAVTLYRSAETADVPFETASPDGSAVIGYLNGHAEITCRTYGVGGLPSPDGTHLGAIVRELGDTGFQDTIWICVLDHTGTPIWASFEGTPGATVYYGTPIAHGLSVGSDPTVTQTGTGTSGDPYIEDFGIPVGATGADGLIDFPALPAAGDSITFTMIVDALGVLLPYKFSAGTTLHVNSTKGFWSGNDSEAIYWTDKAGSPTHNAANSKPFGQLVWQTGLLNSDDLQVTLGTLESYSSDITISDDNTYVSMLENVNTNDPVTGFLLVNITITVPSAGPAGCHKFDFLTSDEGFAVIPGYAGTWTVGVGWHSATGYLGLYKQTPGGYTARGNEVHETGTNITIAYTASTDGSGAAISGTIQNFASGDTTEQIYSTPVSIATGNCVVAFTSDGSATTLTSLSVGSVETDNPFGLNNCS